MRCALLFWKSKNKNKTLHEGLGISDFFSSFKKGSKSCRKILTSARILKDNIVTNNQPCVITFFPYWTFQSLLMIFCLKF